MDITINGKSYSRVVMRDAFTFDPHMKKIRYCNIEIFKNGWFYYYKNAKQSSRLQPGAERTLGTIKGNDSYSMFYINFKIPGYPEGINIFLIPNIYIPMSFNVSELFPLSDDELPDQFLLHDGKTLEVSEEDAIEWIDFHDDEAKQFFTKWVLKLYG